MLSVSLCKTLSKVHRFVLIRFMPKSRGHNLHCVLVWWLQFVWGRWLATTVFLTSSNIICSNKRACILEAPTALSAVATTTVCTIGRGTFENEVVCNKAECADIKVWGSIWEHFSLPQRPSLWLEKQIYNIVLTHRLEGLKMEVRRSPAFIFQWETALRIQTHGVQTMLTLTAVSTSLAVSNVQEVFGFVDCFSCYYIAVSAEERWPHNHHLLTCCDLSSCDDFSAEKKHPLSTGM